MNIPAVVGLAAGIITIIAGVITVAAWMKQAAKQRIERVTTLIKIDVQEFGKVALLSLIESETAKRTEQEVRRESTAQANRLLDKSVQQALDTIVNDVTDIITSEFSLVILNKVWNHIELPFTTKVSIKVDNKAQRAGSKILQTQEQEKIKKEVLEDVIRGEHGDIMERVSACISQLRNWIERIETEVSAAIEKYLPLTGTLEFSHDDKGYEEWVKTHPYGFILNTYQPDAKQKEYMVLHKSKCRHITNFAQHQKGAFTSNGFMKVCANAIEPIQKWAASRGRPINQPIDICGSCKPLDGMTVTQGNPPSSQQQQIPATPLPEKTIPSLQGEQEILLEKCRALPPAQGNYLLNDYVENLLLTVLDFMLTTKVVQKAQGHYLETEKKNIRTHEDLKRLLASQPDTQEGNTRIAQTLWGYNLWTRAEMLRRLVAYFESVGVTNQEQLTKWANNTLFQDFVGKVRGAGYAVFQWLVMRQGVETIKPDVHVLAFVRNALGHPVTEQAAVAMLEQVAKQMGLKAYELDWRIWEWQKGKGAG